MGYYTIIMVWRKTLQHIHFNLNPNDYTTRMRSTIMEETQLALLVNIIYVTTQWFFVQICNRLLFN